MINWADIEQRVEVAQLYHRYGMLLARVNGRDDAPKSFKEPEETWAHQTIELIKSRDWENSTGIDLMLGTNDYRCIDIDGVEDPDNYSNYNDFLSNHAWDFRRFFLFKCLEILGLPSTYEWLVRSPNGYHIIFRAKDVKGMPPTVTYSPNKVYDKKTAELLSFSRIELLWRAQVVMPPSAASNEKKSNGIAEYYSKCYRFVNGFLPHSAPPYVAPSKIDDFFNYFCGENSFADTLDYGYTVEGLPGAKFYNAINKHFVEDGSWAILQQLYEPDSAESPNTHSITSFDGLDRNINWLKACGTPESINKLGITAQLIEGDTNKALRLFEKSDTEQAHYNIACLIARGDLAGTLEDMEAHLAKSSLPKQYKDQLKLFYTLSHNDDSQYVFLAVCTTARLDDMVMIDGVNPNPKLLQVSWLTTDELGTSIACSNIYFPAESFDIPLHISRSGGLTTEQANKFGDDVWDLHLLGLLRRIASKRTIVTFDAPFFKEMLNSAVDNWDIEKWAPTPEVPAGWRDKKYICLKATAARGINEFSSESVIQSFADLYKLIMGEEYTDLKDSIYRAECIKNVFFKMKEKQCRFISIA